jgi:Mrp family chromosome partitioning ATPase
MRHGSFEANKVAPRRGQMVFYGLFGGFAVGLALAALLTLLDRRIRVREDLARLGVPDAGVLASVRSTSAAGGWTLPASLVEIRDDIAKFWTMLPFDRRATAGLRIAFVPCGAGANAGRAAAAFAIGLAAHGGERVLYVTCTEGPTWLAQRLGVQIEHGWSEVVNNECSLAMAAVPTPISGLSYLGAGELGDVVPHPMAGHAFVEMLDRAATEFRFVIVELPDLARMSEGRSVLGVMDGAEIVSCSETGTKQSVREAVAAANSAGARLLGGVLQTPEQSDAPRPAA